MTVQVLALRGKAAFPQQFPKPHQKHRSKDSSSEEYQGQENKHFCFCVWKQAKIVNFLSMSSSSADGYQGFLHCVPIVSPALHSVVVARDVRATELSSDPLISQVLQPCLALGQHVVQKEP